VGSLPPDLVFFPKSFLLLLSFSSHARSKTSSRPPVKERVKRTVKVIILALCTLLDLLAAMARFIAHVRVTSQFLRKPRIGRFRQRIVSSRPYRRSALLHGSASRSLPEGNDSAQGTTSSADKPGQDIRSRRGLE
jgi:hypothetical protein